MLPKKNNKTVLVAPLDWGLGHATRCIPIIRTLASYGCTVIIATSGHHQTLLQQEFPHLQFIHLPGYGITYAKASVLLRLVLQLPRFFRNIRKENWWLQQVFKDYNIDAVISDNRYGLHHASLPCVFITHQLQVQSPPIFKWTERVVRNRLYGFIKNFNQCWVPDIADEPTSLGGKLSHPLLMPPTQLTYIGWLTRFQPQASLSKKYKLLISLSGPEPQRTLLESLLLPQLKDIDGKVLLVRGLPGTQTQLLEIPTNTTVVNHLPGATLQTAIAESEFFLSRCGYSTLMDLQVVACRCIFIPTPGQTEQVYLGKQIATAGKAVVLQQKNINLKKAIEKAATLSYFSKGGYENKTLEKKIEGWLHSIGIA